MRSISTPAVGFWCFFLSLMCDNPDVCLYEAKPNAVARLYLINACAQSWFHIFGASSSL